MRLFSLLLIPAGLLVEGVAVWLFFVGAPRPPELGVTVFVHLIGAAIVTLGVYLALPVTYRSPLGGSLAFIGTSAALIPVLGPLGLTIAMLAGLYRPYHETRQEWDALDMPDLPFQPVDVDPGDVFMRDGLASVLTHFDDRNRRQQAIMACRHLPHRDAVPILRSALGDAADEVRLLAYAMLNTIERDLETQIVAIQNTIAEAGDPDGELHEETARMYWEFSYLQLSRGSAEQLMLDKALLALETALERGATAQRWLLAARVCMQLGRHDEAERALTRADRLGLDEDDSAPWWAELAFRRRQFDAVAPALYRMSRDAAANPVMRPLLEYWL